MFEKLKFFWDALKTALKQTFVKPVVDTAVQEYSDTQRFNLLSVATSKISNLVCTQATFEVESDSTQAEPLKGIVELLEKDLFEVVESLIGYGECYLFPSQDKQGNFYNWIVPLPQMAIVDIEGDRIYQAYAIVDSKEVNNKKYALIRHHLLQDNGTLTISYNVYDESGKPSSVDLWGELNGTAVNYVGANHIGFARYKSPVSSRGQSKLGVPLNFGTAEIEKDIFKCLEDIREEFKFTKTKIFADRSILVKKQYDDKGREVNKYDMPDGLFAIEKRAGQDGSLIDIFNPAIRYSEHYQRLINLFEMWEREVGVSKGILSDNQATSGATATEIRRSNADTLALINNIRNVIDAGNADALQAYNLSLNVPTDLYDYTSSWVDPFADPVQEWTQIKDAVSLGVIEPYRATQWIFPTMTPEEAQEEIARIQANSIASTDFALESALKQ